MNLKSKKINILFAGFIFFSIFLFGFIFTPQAEAACEVLSATFTPSGEQDDEWFKDDNKPAVTVNIKTKDCAGDPIEISIVEDDTIGIDDDVNDPPELDDLEIIVPPEEEVELKLRAGEDECDSFLGIFDCDYYIKVDLFGAGNNYSSEGKDEGELQYECDGFCNTGWGIFEAFDFTPADPGTCQILSATFTPNGLQESGWFKDDTPPDVAVEIETFQCAGKTLEVSVVEKDTGETPFYNPLISLYGDDDITAIDDREISVPDTDLLRINFKAGETECENAVLIVGNIPIAIPDCHYYIKVDAFGFGNNYTTEDKSEGKLSYDCEGTCLKNWQFLRPIEAIVRVAVTEETIKHDSIIVKAAAYTGGNEVPLVIKWGKSSISENETQRKTVQSGGGEPGVYEHEITGLEIDTTYVYQIVNADTDEEYTDVISFTTTEKEGEVVVREGEIGVTQFGEGYELLAPLPIPGETGLLRRIDVKKGFGNYLNIIFKILIGIAGVLAVIMIVIGGIGYMLEESVFAKGESKKKIWAAIWGLLLALGAFIILETINPQLIAGQLGIRSVSVALEEIAGDIDQPFTPLTRTNLAAAGVSCPQGGGTANLASIAQSFSGKEIQKQLPMPWSVT